MDFTHLLEIGLASATNVAIKLSPKTLHACARPVSDCTGDRALVLPAPSEDLALDSHCDDLDEVDDDENVLAIVEVGEGLPPVRLPANATNAFFAADFSMLGFAPLIFEVNLVVLGADGTHIEPEPWLSISGLDPVATHQVVCLLEALQGLAVRHFLVSLDVERELQAVPPAVVLCQLVGLALKQGAKLEVKEGLADADELVCYYFDVMCDILRLTADDFKALLTVTEPLPHIYSIQAASRLVLASTFLRLQEYYECPDEDIRRKCFTLERYKDWYRSSKRKAGSSSHGFNYYLVWSGFNVPSWVLANLRSGKLGPLRVQEEALMSCIPCDAEPHYLIGSCQDNAGTLKHEIAHGLYSTMPEYKDSVQACLANLPEDCRDSMKKTLVSVGYADDDSILIDEIQAYMVSGEALRSELAEYELARVRQEEIRAVFREYAQVI